MTRDSRGKVMMLQGRYRTAQHARFLRRTGAPNRTVQAYIASGARAYTDAKTRQEIGSYDVTFPGIEVSDSSFAEFEAACKV